MFFNEKVKLAFYNLWHRKKTAAQCIAMTSAIMLLVFISSFFITTLVVQLNDNLDNYASKNYIEIENYVYENFELRDNILLDKNMQEQLKSKFYSVGDINYYQTVNTYASDPTCEDLILDGVTYKGNGENSQYWMSLIVKEISTPTFSENLFAEFNKKFPGQKLIKYGRDIQNENEVLFPEEYLAAYGITPDELLNASMVTFDKTFINAKIVGITNSNIKMLDADEKGNLDFANIVLYAEKNVIFYFEPLLTYQCIELNGSAQAKEIVSYLEDVFGENYFIWFGNSANQNKLDVINKILTFVYNIILILFIVIGIALIVFLYSVTQHSIKQKGAYLGMMRAMGFENNFFIMLLEAVIITLFSSLICLGVSLALAFAVKGMVIAFSWTLRYTITINPALFIITFIISFMIVLLLNILLSFFTIKKQNSKTITEALKS